MTETTDPNGHGARAADDHPSVLARGELDWENADEFARRIRAACGRSPRLLTVDLSAVTFADSSVLHTLFEAHRQLAATGGRLLIAGPLHPSVQRLFEVSATIGHFHFAPPVEQAADAPAGKTPSTSNGR
ncbi:hypothetical protein CFP65_0343 [Kitasatospora sp. MMS16-BH015]|uniref:STAS domain-containing protein n=1 Tax=Kitasatospora sp. MMS16-BH015 TaxID=2018025 RepID=UPI000CA0A0AF|nr:STAS domain-containing protein [Kitasatospora sp. MMS16-BH015]AUG75315.1 hypothetical protein CFP65_0343 [Kitasatospora sp. MMS16-BH015]